MTKHNNYQICTRCVMDTTDPDIVFDENGVCNHCHAYDKAIKLYVHSGDEGKRELERIVSKIKVDGKNKKYDSIIGVSGGVDSTYVAYMVRKLGLRPLAVHLDNGWDSELAIKNVENICRLLEIDLQTIVLDWDEFRDLQLSFLKSSTPDCEIPSDHAISAAMRITARQNGVKHIITGSNIRTESHLPSAWSQGHLDWKYIRSVQKQFGKIRLKNFPHLKSWDFYLRSYNKGKLNILDYLDYSKSAAMPILQNELGWKYYGGKHYESIYTRWYQGFWLPSKFGYDKRKTHFSSLICSGEMGREEVLQELNNPIYPDDLQKADTEYVLKKFNLTENEFKILLENPNKSYWDYESYGRLYKTWMYGFLRTLYHQLRKSKA